MKRDKKGLGGKGIKDLKEIKGFKVAMERKEKAEIEDFLYIFFGGMAS